MKKRFRSLPLYVRMLFAACLRGMLPSTVASVMALGHRQQPCGCLIALMRFAIGHFMTVRRDSG